MSPGEGPQHADRACRLLEALTRRVHGIYAAVIQSDGETFASAGEPSIHPHATVLGLALLSGSSRLSGAAQFEQAYLTNGERAFHVERIGPDHLMCVLLEPKTAGSRVEIQAAAAQLRDTLLSPRERLRRF